MRPKTCAWGVGFALALSIVVSCARHSGRAGVAPLPAYATAVTDIWLGGVDRDWPELDPEAVCDAALRSGLTGISIELVAWDQVLESPRDYEHKLKSYARECRKRKLVLFISVINDWVDKRWWETSTPATMLELVLALGPEGLIVQPVGEAHTEAGKRFELQAHTMLKAQGFKDCRNTKARPTRADGFDYFAYHASTVDDTGPIGCLWITDHGTLLRWIGWPPNASRVKRVADGIRAAGGRGFGLYSCDMRIPKRQAEAAIPEEAWAEVGNARRDP